MKDSRAAKMFYLFRFCAALSWPPTAHYRRNIAACAPMLLGMLPPPRKGA